MDNWCLRIYSCNNCVLEINSSTSAYDISHTHMYLNVKCNRTTTTIKQYTTVD